MANKHGGGAKTNANGLRFEQDTSLNTALINAGYRIQEEEVFSGNKSIGFSVPQHKLYSKFLEPNGIHYSDYNSKKWLPDECFINKKEKTAYIIEKKFQNSPGSVDEKLQGCDFKKKMYKNLFTPLDYNVVYLYVFNDWFKHHRYRDILDYIKEKGCYYFFNEIPLSFLGLS